MVEESVKMMICDWHLAMEMKFKSSSSRDEHIQGWLQGDVVDVVSKDGEEVAIIDDGTGVALVDRQFLKASFDAIGIGWRPSRGMHIQVLGHGAFDEKDNHVFMAHKFSDLTAEPDRLALWLCEVIETRSRFNSLLKMNCA